MYGKKQNYWSLVTEMATVRIVKKKNILILSVCLSVYLYIHAHSQLADSSVQNSKL